MVPEENQPSVTALLLAWNAGDADALGQLTPAVYGELRKLARGLLTRERAGHTWSATELVHEAFLCMAGQHSVSFQNQAHFYGSAANIMRRVLVDHARRKFAHKRGGDAPKIALEDVPAEGGAAGRLSEDVVELDAALDDLERIDPRKARVVEMKFFGGLTNPEVALALDISEATVERDWRVARAWLIQAVSGDRRTIERH